MRKRDKAKLAKAIARAPAPGECQSAPSLSFIRRYRTTRNCLEETKVLLEQTRKKLPKFPMQLEPGVTKGWVLAENADGAFITQVIFDAERGKYWDEIKRVKGGPIVWYDRVLGAVSL